MLIILSQYLISISYARGLYKACPSQEDTFVQIPDSNHKDIFIRNVNANMQAVRNLAAVLTKG